MMVFLDLDFVDVIGDHFKDTQTGQEVKIWHSATKEMLARVTKVTGGQVIYEAGGVPLLASIGIFVSTWTPLDPLAHKP